jgi:predicted metal-dependent enzyme (double-stranded beta helix superfamily)|tara:strand:- start:399 stop:983 length:585 start_codon:yes stop_codon:yes gene_type:complete
MTREKMLPAVEEFISDMRAVFAEINSDEKWGRCRQLLGKLLADSELQKHAKDWPVGGFDGKKVDNLLFYEDPDHGFVINGLIKNPGGRAMIHDHGKAWTIYGVLAGEERVVRYREIKKDDGEVGFEEEHAVMCRPGDVDVVPPWEIHSEYAGDEKSIAVIVRSQRSGTFEQYRYLDDGGKVRFPGPNQVPYDLR